MVWFDEDYGYKKKITIDNTKVAGNETDFPILISVTDEDLADTGNGGHVESANGYDIIFTNDDEDTLLKHEIERYINTDGTLVFWVKVDSLSGGVNTDIYIYYGKDGVGADPSSTDTWDANFVGVYHMGDTAGGCHDSTSNGNDGTYGGDLPTRVVGSKCGWAQDFDGTGDFLNLPSGCHTPTQGTYEIQMKADTTPNHVRLIEAGDEANYRQHFDLRGDVTRHDINWKYVGQEWVDADPTDPDTNDNYYVVSFESGDLDWFQNNTNRGSSGIATANFDYDNFYIGCANGVAVFLDGKISEIRISNIKRSDNWLETTYNTQTSPDTFMSWGEEETSVPANNPPDAPITPDPTDDEEDVGLNPDLSVYVEDADADAMNVRFYNADGDVLIDTDLAVASGTRAQVTWADLEYSTVYEWYAIADDGEDTTQSETWQFTTEDEPANAAPDVPSQPDPAHNETGVEVNPDLSVLVGDDDEEDMDVTFYDASDDSVINTDLNVADGDRATVVWSGLTYETEYNWYAVADDGTDTTSSPTFTFTTKAEPETCCATFTIVGDETVTLTQPIRGGANLSISKKIDRTSFWSGNYEIDDDGINSQPLVLQGIETFDSVVSITTKMVKLLDMADNNEEVAISGFGNCLDGVYVIRQFSYNTIRRVIKAYGWRLTLEKV